MQGRVLQQLTSLTRRHAHNSMLQTFTRCMTTPHFIGETISNGESLFSAVISHRQNVVFEHCYLPNTNAAAGVPVVYHPLYSAPQLSHGHRFPMQVFKRIFDTLLNEGVISQQQVHVPPKLPSRDMLLRVHDEEYIDSFLSGRLDAQRLRRIGFGEVTSTQILIDRTLSEVAGTILTAELALEHKLAVNCAGGTHHAFPDCGSGFCIINDLAITTEFLLASVKVKRILILDLDVHQGDGTAYIFQGRQDVFTLSIHAESNFPARKQTSHLDIGLPDGTTDTDYLATVAKALTSVLAEFKPDLVLYDAGVDIHIDDSLGRLSITDSGLKRREYLVLDTCLAAGIPIAGYVGGGYHPNLDILAQRHCHLHKAAVDLWTDYELGGGVTEIETLTEIIK